MEMASMPLIDVLIFATLVITWFILTTSVNSQIYLYQGLSGLLAVRAVWLAVTSRNAWILLVAAIPLGMVVFVRPLLRYVAGSASIVAATTPAQIERLTVRQRVSFFIAGLTLTTLAFSAVLVLLADVREVDVIRLATALTMILLGVFMWTVRNDLLSQAIGLLVMDHGLFLIAESVIPRVALTIVLIVCLFVYLSVPLTCLGLVLPKLRQMPDGLRVDRHRKLKG